MKISNPFAKKNIFFLSPLILVMIFDLFFTLAGQSKEYWQVSYKFFNEGSPLGALMLGLHPAIFVLFFAFYVFSVLFLTANLKKPLNIMIAVAFFLGHGWGSASWVPVLARRFFPIENFDFSGWYFTIAYFVFIAIISGIFINKWFEHGSSN